MFHFFYLSLTYTEWDTFQESEDNDDLKEIWAHEKCGRVSKGKLSKLFRYSIN